MQASVLKAVRKTHLYLGLFITPAVLFFAFTGAMQTFSLHQAAKGSTYKPANWIVALAQIHKKQTLDLPPQRTEKTPSVQTDARPKPNIPTGLVEGGSRTPHNAMPLKIFFLIVSIGLSVSTLSGMYMSYKYSRSKVWTTLTLLAGIGVPVICSML